MKINVLVNTFLWFTSKTVYIHYLLSLHFEVTFYLHQNNRVLLCLIPFFFIILREATQHAHKHANIQLSTPPTHACQGGLDFNCSTWEAKNRKQQQKTTRNINTGYHHSTIFNCCIKHTWLISMTLGISLLYSPTWTLFTYGSKTFYNNSRHSLHILEKKVRKLFHISSLSISQPPPSSSFSSSHPLSSII